MPKWHIHIGISTHAERVFWLTHFFWLTHVQDAHGGFVRDDLSAHHLAKVGVEGSNPFAQGAHQLAEAGVFPGERGTPFSGWSKAKSALDTASVFPGFRL